MVRSLYATGRGSHNIEMTNRPAEPDFFATTWAVYEAVVEHDYLWHAMANDALRRLIDARFGAERPIRFLDLASGDSASTSRVLANRPLARYVGVDRSEQALAAAEAHVKRLNANVELIAADYVEFLEGCGEQFDVIYIGLSSHHLDEASLPRFFSAIRRCLAPNGFFAAYEPFTLPDETREEHIERLCAIIDHWWMKMTGEQRDGVKAHIRANDYPLPLARWNTLAEVAGFGRAFVATKTPDRISMLVAHGLNPSP
jgi:SAM-dependent methyltransferase